MIYKPLKKNPLSGDREVTDSSYIYLSYAICLVWFGLCICAFVTGTIDFRYLRSGFVHVPQEVFFFLMGSYIFKYAAVIANPSMVDPIILLEQYERKSLLAVITIILVIATILILVGKLRLIQWFPTAFVYIGIVYLVFPLVEEIIFMILRIKDSGLAEIVSSAFLPLIMFPFMALYVHCISVAGPSAVAEVIEKSFQAMVFFRHIILFLLCTEFLTLLVTLFTLTAMAASGDDKMMICIIFLGGWHITSYIMVFKIMVISLTSAFWHYAPDKGEISSTIILDSMKQIYKFHRGSVAWCAIPLWPWLVAIYCFHRHTFPRCKNWFMDLLAKAYVLMDIMNLVSIVIPIHGVGFTEATKKTFSCTLSNCITVLAVLPMIKHFFGIGFKMASWTSMLLSSLLHSILLPDTILMFVLNLSFCSSIIVMALVLKVVTQLIYTTLICSFDGDE